MRKIKYFLFTILMLGIMILPTLAYAETGAISFEVPEEAISFTDIEMSLYEVATYRGSYELTAAFQGSGVDLGKIGDSASELQAAISKLEAYVKSQGIQPLASAKNEGGTIEFPNLEYRVYLGVQTGGKASFVAQSVLIEIPNKQGSSQIPCKLKGEVPDGAVILKKHSDAGTPLKDAVFMLEKKTYLDSGATVPEGADIYRDGDGAEYYWELIQNNLHTDANGQIGVDHLALGTYQFTETEVPDGCVNLPAYVPPFEVKSGKISEVEGYIVPVDGDVEELDVNNDRTTTKVYKTDKDKKALAGAVLVIKDSNGNIITDDKGNAKYKFTTTTEATVLRGLPAGTYYLSEVSAPTGYKIAADVKFTVSDDPDASNEVTMVDLKASTTTTKPNTPKTGDNTPIIPLVIALLAAIAAIAGIIVFKKKSY